MADERILTEGELNSLELVFGGLLPALEIEGDLAIGAAVDLLDREQTPVARFVVAAVEGHRMSGSVEQLRPLGRRPFAALRIARPELMLGDVAIMSDDGSAVSGEPPRDRTVVVIDDGDPEKLSRRLRAVRALGLEPRVLPSDGGSAAAEILLAAGATSVEVWSTERFDTGGLVVFFTGLSGSGKSTIAQSLADRLRESDPRPVTLLDGDEVRTMLSAGLGFSREDRDLNIRRIAWVAALAAQHGGIAICAPIAPYHSTRSAARNLVEARGGRFVLVHISTPIEVCEARDRKGLYAKARAGEIRGFTGIDDPYEEPWDAELTIDASVTTSEDAVSAIISAVASPPAASPWLSAGYELPKTAPPTSMQGKSR